MPQPPPPLLENPLQLKSMLAPPPSTPYPTPIPSFIASPVMPQLRRVTVDLSGRRIMRETGIQRQRKRAKRRMDQNRVMIQALIWSSMQDLSGKPPATFK